MKIIFDKICADFIPKKDDEEMCNNYQEDGYCKILCDETTKELYECDDATAVFAINESE